MKGRRWHPQPCTSQVRQCPALICLSLSQFGLLTGLGALGLMVWLTATPHSRETEQKRLGMLVGFAFLTGRWAPRLPPTSHRTPNPAEGPDGAPRMALVTPSSVLPGINLGPLLQMCISINPR